MPLCGRFQISCRPQFIREVAQQPPSPNFGWWRLPQVLWADEAPRSSGVVALHDSESWPHGLPHATSAILSVCLIRSSCPTDSSSLPTTSSSIPTTGGHPKHIYDHQASSCTVTTAPPQILPGCLLRPLPRAPSTPCLPSFST